VVEEIAHAQPGIDNRKALDRGEWRLRYIALFPPLLINSNFVFSDCNEFIGIRHLPDVRQQIRTNVGLDFSAGEGEESCLVCGTFLESWTGPWLS
jgi:hypothetical protein